MFTNILFFLTSVSSLWNVSINNIGEYSLSFRNKSVLSNNCPQLILSDYGTRVSLCDPKLYSPPILDTTINNSREKSNRSPHDVWCIFYHFASNSAVWKVNWNGMVELVV